MEAPKPSVEPISATLVQPFLRMSANTFWHAMRSVWGVLKV
ncbi:Uncharacterised protein [Bordetella pertussis]|nr:Uncharacterised protein [Bordetella pertussis]CPL92748.1 Uncharacterised protein [Bordetella pertussis]CPM99145.1 Uncharacterised protein [Bordetella pertussis]CPN65805.1 Uncharacterised protein [Bordetella pertussis]CPO40832.1 Uncharacterised protein [Bordetella pertussis]